jgi:carboxymethylenebutenolidase
VSASLAGLLAATAGRAGRAQPAASASERVSMTLAGGRTSAGRVYRPVKTPAPGVLVVPDGFGAGPEMDRIAELLVFEGFAAVVVDLYDGKTAGNDVEAAALAGGLDGEVARAALGQWFDWLRSRDFCNQRLASVGFGVGASHAVFASSGARVSATCLYYARVDDPPEKLHHIDGKIIGHFAERDTWATPFARFDLEQRLKRVQRDFQFHVYRANGGFAHPRSRHHAPADAALAWNRTVALFRPACGLAP